MLKFIKHHMTSIDGVDLFPVMAFILFFSLFVGVLWWVKGMRRAETDRMSALPLTGNEHQPHHDHAR